ncbi:MAG: 30S ribosomal protein S6 [Chloroflexota bacterium]
MKLYEMTFIVRPDLDEDQTREAAEQIEHRLQEAGGEIRAAYPWAPPRRRLAFPIRDFNDGYYITTVFDFDPQALREFERVLHLNENLLRFLIVEASERNIKQAETRLQQLAQAAMPRPEQPVLGQPQQGEVQTPQPAEGPQAEEHAEPAADAEKPEAQPVQAQQPAEAELSEAQPVQAQQPAEAEPSESQPVEAEQLSEAEQPEPLADTVEQAESEGPTEAQETEPAAETQDTEEVPGEPVPTAAAQSKEE